MQDQYKYIIFLMGFNKREEIALRIERNIIKRKVKQIKLNSNNFKK